MAGNEGSLKAAFLDDDCCAAIESGRPGRAARFLCFGAQERGTAASETLQRSRPKIHNGLRSLF